MGQKQKCCIYNFVQCILGTQQANRGNRSIIMNPSIAVSLFLYPVCISMRNGDYQ